MGDKAMEMEYDEIENQPLVLGDNDYASVTDKICSLAERPRPPRAWYIAFAISSTFAVILVLMICFLLWAGLGIWGVKRPVVWGFAIVNFVYWIGIGHAGTLISAILFLFRQTWRTGINRFAEAMTIFAVVCAAIFPTIHVGRPWVIYWALPIPNWMRVWPNFRSPIPWDAFAISTYFTVSLIFWYLGMVPDLASLLDRAKTRLRHVLYGLFSLGWRGSGRQWLHYEWAYLLLAALATPLVISVHSVVSFDFATANLPGWHSTIFPPYFVIGAIFCGLAMVIVLAVPAREYFGLKDFITMRHLEYINKLILGTGMIIAYSYLTEFFVAWYGGNKYEIFTVLNRALGPYAWSFWIMIACNVFAPQLFWFKKCRRSLWVMFAVGVLVNIGMWFERFVIIVSSTSADFLPSSWGYYKPTWVDVLTLMGSFGLFFTCFLLFCRYLPIVAMAEIKGVMRQERGGNKQA